MLYLIGTVMIMVMAVPSAHTLTFILVGPVEQVWIGRVHSFPRPKTHKSDFQPLARYLNNPLSNLNIHLNNPSAHDR